MINPMSDPIDQCFMSFCSGEPIMFIILGIRPFSGVKGPTVISYCRKCSDHMEKTTPFLFNTLHKITRDEALTFSILDK